MGVVLSPGCHSTLFGGGTIWTGVDGQTTDALLVVDGVVRRSGRGTRTARRAPRPVDLDGGFLMPSFGDGHAHPLLGGLEAVGPQVRPCKSVDEIVAGGKEIRRRASRRRVDRRRLLRQQPGPRRPVRRALARRGGARPAGGAAGLGLPHGVVQHRRAGAGGHHRRHPDPVLGEIPRRDDGSVLGTLREWGAVDLVLQRSCPHATERCGSARSARPPTTTWPAA